MNMQGKGKPIKTPEKNLEKLSKKALTNPETSVIISTEVKGKHLEKLKAVDRWETTDNFIKRGI